MTDASRRTGRRRQAPALASRLAVAATATWAVFSLIGWMGRAARSGAASGEAAETEAIGPTVRRVVVVAQGPEPEPYVTLEAVPAGTKIVVVSQPARVVRRTTASTASGPAPAPVTKSSGS